MCFFSIIGAAFALPLTLTQSSTQVSENDVVVEKVDYVGNVEHLFSHCLLAYPAIALSNENTMQADYDRDCITPSEFEKILQSLYDNNYALIDINSVFEKINGKVVKKQIKMPIGKKPLILSFDDVNYDTKKMHNGMVDKIILDKNGNLAAQTEITWSNIPKTEITYDNEFIPILETFVDEYPDFSVDGAKGTICLTGYDGILGYRTSKRNIINREQEIAQAKIVVEKLVKNGWNFACHSFGHYHMTKISDEKFAEELKNWQDQVEPITGKTRVYVYPYGEWELVNSDGTPTAKHQMLLDAGFELFCGVGMQTFFSYMPFSKNSTKTLFMDRKAIDGTTLRNQKQTLSPFFDTTKVYDYKYRNYSISNETSILISMSLK